MQCLNVSTVTTTDSCFVVEFSMVVACLDVAWSVRPDGQSIGRSVSRSVSAVCWSHDDLCENG